MKSSLTARRVQPWKIEPRQEPRSREERVDLVDIAVQELAIRRTRPRRQEPARPWASNAVPSTTPTSGTRSCIPSSTTTPEWPTPRSTTTEPLTPLLGCCAARWVGLAPAESALPASCAITVSAIAHTPGATPAPNCRSVQADETLLPPDQRQDLNDFTAPWPTNGPSPAITPTNSLVDRLCRRGYTSTVTTGNTQRSARSHPSRD